MKSAMIYKLKGRYEHEIIVWLIEGKVFYKGKIVGKGRFIRRYGKKGLEITNMDKRFRRILPKARR